MPMEYINLTDWYSLQRDGRDVKCDMAPGQGRAGLTHCSEAGTCHWVTELADCHRLRLDPASESPQKLIKSAHPWRFLFNRSVAQKSVPFFF